MDLTAEEAVAAALAEGIDLEEWRSEAFLTEGTMRALSHIHANSATTAMGIHFPDFQSRCEDRRLGAVGSLGERGNGAAATKNRDSSKHCGPQKSD